MGEELNIINPLHKKTSRDYVARMIDDKIVCMTVAKKYDKDFWDGDRKYGYGGYKYIPGRFEKVAKALIERYNLPDNAKILDMGCGKGFLLYEIKKLLPNCTVKGYDISEYAIENSKEEIKENLFVHKVQDKTEFDDNEFDLVFSITTFHNLNVMELKDAVKEMDRIGKNKYLVVESYRNDAELFNLECWALTCDSFFRPEEWVWLYNEFGYTGDYEFIYFE